MTTKQRQQLIVELAGCKATLANPTEVLLSTGGTGTLAEKRARIERHMRDRIAEIEALLAEPIEPDTATD